MYIICIQHAFSGMAPEAYAAASSPALCPTMHEGWMPIFLHNSTSPTWIIKLSGCATSHRSSSSSEESEEADNIIAFNDLPESS